VATARAFLAQLVRGQSDPATLPAGMPAADRLAPWLLAHELGPPAWFTFQKEWPEIGRLLLPDWYNAVAESRLHGQSLATISATFSAADLPHVLFKGAALAHTVYPDPACRVMSDLDIWVEAARREEAVSLLTAARFVMLEKEQRIGPVYYLWKQEDRFVYPDWQKGMLELHRVPLNNWWYDYAATPDPDGMWQRREALQISAEPGTTFQLSPEDSLIQIATHLAISNQFSRMLLRSLTDMALLVLNRPIDWSLLVRHATQWRLGSPVWLALHLADQLFDLPQSAPARHLLRPAAWRAHLLQSLVKPERALHGTALPAGGRLELQQLVLLLMAARGRDVARIVRQHLFPNAAWREVHYGRPTSLLAHFRHLLRHRTF
jgi:hypothetical protein